MAPIPNPSQPQSQHGIPVPSQSAITHKSTLCHIQLLYRFVPSRASFCSAGIAISKHFIVTHLAQMGHRRLPPTTRFPWTPSWSPESGFQSPITHPKSESLARRSWLLCGNHGSKQSTMRFVFGLRV